MNKIIQYSLTVLLFIVALNAFAGGYYGLAGAKNVPLEWLEGTPFRDYTIPSTILIVVVGGSCLLAAIAILRLNTWSKKAARAAGIIMVGWITVQVSMIGYVSWMQPAIVICGLVTLFLVSQLHVDKEKTV